MEIQKKKNYCAIVIPFLYEKKTKKTKKICEKKKKKYFFNFNVVMQRCSNFRGFRKKKK